MKVCARAAGHLRRHMTVERSVPARNRLQWIELAAAGKSQESTVDRCQPFSNVEKQPCRKFVLRQVSPANQKITEFTKPFNIFPKNDPAGLYDLDWLRSREQAGFGSNLGQGCPARKLDANMIGVRLGESAESVVSSQQSIADTRGSLAVTGSLAAKAALKRSKHRILAIRDSHAGGIAHIGTDLRQCLRQIVITNNPSSCIPRQKSQQIPERVIIGVLLRMSDEDDGIKIAFTRHFRPGIDPGAESSRSNVVVIELNWESLPEKAGDTEGTAFDPEAFNHFALPLTRHIT